MSTCDQIEVEACPVHDTVTDNAPGCDEPDTVQAKSVDVAEVVEQLPLTEEQQDELQVLEEVPEDVCDTGDVGGSFHQGTSEEQESLAAEVVPGEDLEISCKVVEQDASAATESETKSTENSGDAISVEICSEDNAQGEEQPSKVDESAQEIPTPQQQRKLAKLAQREGKEKETMAGKDAQSTITESDFDSSTILNEASANKTHETQDTPPVASSSEGEATNKLRKLNSKQRKARNKRLETEKAGASVAADTVEKTVNSLAAPVASSPVTVATMGTEEATQKRRKLTSSERRARKLAQEAEKSTRVVPAPVATTEPKPASTQQDTEPNAAATKTKKLSGKQRKAKKRAAEAAQAAATLAGLADAELVAGAITAAPVVAGGAAVAPEESANSAPLRKKLTSTERRAKRDAKLAVAEAAPSVIEPPVPAPGTIVPSTADKGASTKEATEAAPKAKKLSSKQRKAARRARDTAETEATAATQGVQAAVLKPVAPVQVPADKNASKEIASNKKVSSTPVTPASVAAVLTPDQSIALHASLAVVRQGLLSRDSVIYTQQGAMKMHVLTELCKLGYSCIEGSASNFQQITWCSTNQCLTYTTAIVNAPHQYPAALRAKGELKIATPGLSVQLNCYPTFGAGSPDLMGRKNFRNGFVRHFEEVAACETDCFVFVLPIGVYNQYAREAVKSLPVAQTIQQHFSGHVVVHVNKNQEEIRLNGVFCSVDTLYGEFIVGSVLLA